MRTSVEVHNFLVERGAAHEVFSTRGRLRSPEQIAAVFELPPEEVGRVVIYEGRSGPVAAVVPSTVEPDPNRVGRAFGEGPLEPAREDRATELTGYLSEAIPPAGLPEDFGVVVDRALDRDAVFYFAGGEPRAVLKIRGKDLVKATRAKVARLGRRSERAP